MPPIQKPSINPIAIPIEKFSLFICLFPCDVDAIRYDTNTYDKMDKIYDVVHLTTSFNKINFFKLFTSNEDPKLNPTANPRGKARMPIDRPKISIISSSFL